METLRDEAAPVDLPPGRGEHVPDLGRPAGGLRAQHGDLVQGALLHGGLDQSAVSVEVGGPMRADLDEPEDQLEHAAGPHHVRGLQSLGVVALVDGDELTEDVQSVHIGGRLGTQSIPSHSLPDILHFWYLCIFIFAILGNGIPRHSYCSHLGCLYTSTRTKNFLTDSFVKLSTR